MTINPPIQVSQSAPSAQKGTRNKLPPVDHYFLDLPTDFLDSLRHPSLLKLLAVLIISPPLKPYTHIHPHTHPPTYNNLSIWDQPPLQPHPPSLTHLKPRQRATDTNISPILFVVFHTSPSYYPSLAISSLIWTRNNAKHRSNLQALEELQSIPAQIKPLEPLPR